MKPASDPHDAGVPCPNCDYDLRANTTSSCPECGIEYAIVAAPLGEFSPPPIRGWLAHLRLGLTLLALAPAATAFAVHLKRFVSPAPLINGPELYVVIFGLLTLCGTMALGTLCVLRKFHFGISTFYFGLVSFLFMVNIGSDLLAGTSFATIWTTVLSYASEAFFMLVGFAGIVVEIACERRSSRTYAGILRPSSTNPQANPSTSTAPHDAL